MKLSIVIPTTGRGTLARAVDAAWRCADQVIVVADGAPEVTADVHVDFGAPGLVRNAAAPYITGDWVGFCDDDDVLVPDVYRSVVEDHAEGVDVIVHTMADPEYGLIPRPLPDVPLFHGNVGISFTLRTELFRAHPFIAGPPLTMRGEDYELVTRLVEHDARLVVSGAVAYLVRPEEVPSG